MKRWLILFVFLILGLSGLAQSFEIIDKQESFQAAVSETIQIPIKIRNGSDKAQFYIIRKVQSDLGSTQKGYFCFDKICLEPGIDEFSKRLEPGETVEKLHYTLETGLVTGQNSLRFEVFVKGNPAHSIDHAVNIFVDEKRSKSHVFASKDITIHDVYPNPVVDQAFIDYRLHNENLKAKIVIHNILGSTMSENELPSSETRVKMQTYDLAAGIYFYTLYLDNNGVLTRKLIVRK
jgi:hypothetical protein